MRMPDPVPTFSEVVTRIRDDYPAFAYIHILEPTTHHGKAAGGKRENGKTKESNKFLRDIWGDRVYIANSDFGRDSAIEAVEKEGGLISFARHFISNVSFCSFFVFLSKGRDIDFTLDSQPDLPLRLKDNIELAPSDPKTHYASGPEGYTDYPFAAETGASSLKHH
jgi:NADPH2 dehydrogenase